MLAITNYNKVTVCLERPLLGHIPGNLKGLLFDDFQPGEGGQHGGRAASGNPRRSGCCCAPSESS